MGIGRAPAHLCRSAFRYSRMLTVSIVCLVSCSGASDAPSGHVESPVEHRRAQAPKSPPSMEAASESPQLPDAAPTRPDCRQPHRADEPCPQVPTMALSPIDRAIADDYPAKRWSKNMPDRACIKDDECGDGFCDRDRCAPIYTWTARYGQRCDATYACPGSLLCIDGRCRSCVSDAECVTRHSNSSVKCLRHSAAQVTGGCGHGDWR
jgi:hypothetical protein